MSELELLKKQNRELLWQVVESHTYIEKVLKMLEVTKTFSDDSCQWQARYERTIKDAGLEKEADEIRNELED